MEIREKLLKKINSNYYNLQTYRDLMKYLSSNYKFRLFSKKKVETGIYLRHDIDVHPKFIEGFLPLYSELKIKANFFFLIK